MARATSPPMIIYALCDPATGEPRYIGKTRCIASRLKSHARAKSLPAVAAWLATLASGPMVVILEDTRCMETAAGERWWIGYARRLGYALLNKDRGSNKEMYDRGDNDATGREPPRCSYPGCCVYGPFSGDLCLAHLREHLDGRLTVHCKKT